MNHTTNGPPENLFEKIINKVIRFCLENKLLVVLFILIAVTWGILVAPFDWDAGGLTRSPVPVDAIPDIGENPLTTIKNVKRKIEEISPGLPKKTLPDGTVSQVKIVPFYDRSGLIHETLGTLNRALVEEILVTIIVVIFMVSHLRSSILISGLLPLAVLLCFIAMKGFGVDANIVALSGIAIAIGTMVDMGVIISENILRHLEKAGPHEKSIEVIYRAASEVGSAVMTAVATTVISFLPVFTMEAAEGKLFKPLAFTKTFALVASLIVAITVIPPFAHMLFTARISRTRLRKVFDILLVLIGLIVGLTTYRWAGLALIVVGLFRLLSDRIPQQVKRWLPKAGNGIAILAVAFVLADHWSPLGPEKGIIINLFFVLIIILGFLFLMSLFQRLFPFMLRWCLDHKPVFLAVPILLVLFGGLIWLGFDRMDGFLPESVKRSSPAVWARHAFPGLGKEFMPPLDEGSFLLMPTTMPHASIGEALDVLQKQDMALSRIPEIDTVVGKIGRVESSLDPAPVSMIETVIGYKSEFITDKDGHRLNFKVDRKTGTYPRDERGDLIPDPNGRPYRQWRSHIQSPDDIWKEIVKAAEIPGTTSAPKLQPIAARLVMLQSGMRAPMGIKIKGGDLQTIEQVGIQIEGLLKQVPSVEPAALFADRNVGKPYLEIDIDREAIARFGITVRQVQDVIEIAIGGRRVTTTVEGRERYPVRVRYLRELRDSFESLGQILVPAADGSQIPLTQLSSFRYVRGPQAIKSEDTFLVGYVLFDKKPGFAEVEVVEECQSYLEGKIASGEFELPAGISYAFAGSFENQVRSEKRLMIVLPAAFLIIFIILYLQFRSVPTTFIVFSGILVAWAGGFLMIWCYSQPWFLDFSVSGIGMRELFQVHPLNLSVAIWVGFLALFGIASDDGVIMATYLDQRFADRKARSVKEIREATLEGALRRIRPCLMTSATTILALIPVLTSSGRGSDIMVPMAIPSFGGMCIVMVTVFVVPVLYCWVKEMRFKLGLPVHGSASSPQGGSAGSPQVGSAGNAR